MAKNKGNDKIRFVFKKGEWEEFQYRVGSFMFDNNFYIKGYTDKDGIFYIAYIHEGWMSTLLEAVKFTPIEGQIYEIYLVDKKIVVDSKGPSKDPLDISDASSCFSDSGLPRFDRYKLI